jgi:hypothetical protein
MRTRKLKLPATTAKTWPAKRPNIGGTTMKRLAISTLALSAFVASCAQTPPPLKVLPADPVHPKLTIPNELLERPGCVLRPKSFCEPPKTKSGTTN